MINRKRPDRAHIIKELVIFCRRKNIVEIGVCYGDTTLALCEAAKKTGGHVWGYDLWGIHGLKNQYKQKGTREEVEEKLREQGHNNFSLIKIDTTTEKFKKLIKENTPKIDFCFIDGCHSYKGVKNDFDVVYPLLAPEGMIIFHDTCKIDGCREFIIDLRTKYNDGTYDIINLPWDNKNKRSGISILQKRTYPTQNYKIDEKCGSPSNPDGIYKKEKNWFKGEIERYKK